MIHFRLGRSLRLAVDFLSLNFVGSTLGSHSTAVLRGIHADASTALDPSDLPPVHFALAPRSIVRAARKTRWRSSGKRISLSARRYLAAIGLVLALALEFRECNPVRDVGYKLDPSAESRPVWEIAPPELNVSFYDPVETSNGPTDPQLTLSGLPVDLQPEALEAKPLPWAIPESVFFVYKARSPDRRHTQRPDEQQHYQPPVATAFVLSVPDRTHNRFVRFLVTARHVVDPRWAHCSDRNPASIDVRLNRRSGGVGYEAISLQSGPDRRFYTSSDPTADLAVIPLDHDLIARLDEYKFLDIPFRLLPTESEMRLVHPDQPIMTAGLSPRSSGERGNYPVFDAGLLSKMSSEAVGVQCGTAQTPQSPAMPLHVWFISAGLAQGASGAPVYTFVLRGAGAFKTPVLLGIQSIAWPERGVAGITPSSVLGDLVRSALHESKLNFDFYRGPNPAP